MTNILYLLCYNSTTLLLRCFLIFDTGTPLNNFTNSGKYRVHKVISLHGTTVSKPKSTNSKNRKGSRDQHRRTSTSDGAIEQQIQGQHPDDDPKDLVERCAIAVRSPEKSFVLVADTEKECNEWLEAIRNATEALSANEVVLGDGRKSIRIKSSFAHTSVLDSGGDGARTAPVWVPDNAHKCCMIKRCSRKFNMLRRKHHCRSCGKVVCDACSQNRRILPHINKKKQLRVCDTCVIDMNNGTGRFDILRNWSSIKKSVVKKSIATVVAEAKEAAMLKKAQETATETATVTGTVTGIETGTETGTRNQNNNQNNNESDMKPRPSILPLKSRASTINQSVNPNQSNIMKRKSRDRRIHKKETDLQSLEHNTTQQTTKTTHTRPPTLTPTRSIHFKNSRLLRKRLSSAKMKKTQSSNNFRRIGSGMNSIRKMKPIGFKRQSRSMQNVQQMSTMMQQTPLLDEEDEDDDEEDEEDEEVEIVNSVEEDDWLLGTPKFGLRSNQLTEFSTAMLGGNVSNIGHVKKNTFFGDDMNIDAIEEEPEVKKMTSRAPPIKVRRVAPPPPANRKRGKLRQHPEKLRQEANRQRILKSQQEALAYQDESPMSSKLNNTSLRSKPKRRAKNRKSMESSLGGKSLKTSRSGKNLLRDALR